MRTCNTPTKSNFGQNTLETKSVDLCISELKKKGLDKEKIELLENNIRGIINRVIDEYEN